MNQQREKMNDATQTALFVAQLDEAQRAEAAAIEDLEELLEGYRVRGAAAFGGLVLGEGVFVSELAARLVAAPPKQGLLQWLEHVQPEDFHLALACGAGIPGAIAAFELRYKADLERLIRKYEGADVPAEDLIQQLREKLFVSTETRKARIMSYSGQGFLQNWLRVTGARTFIDILRSAARKQDKAMITGGGGDRILEVPDMLQDVELDFLKREYRGQFKEAFAAAVQELSPHQRNLLRQHLIHQLTVEQLGKLYGTHASTASRRITKAREALLDATRREFMVRLKLDTQEFDSIMFMIRSKLDLSLPRLLESVVED